MIVIVETTFIIEIVIEQDESAACEEILRLTAPPKRESRILARYAQVLSDLKTELLLAETSADERYNDFCARRIGAAQTIEVTQRILTDALIDRNVGIMEKLPDAIVLSSVLSFLDEIRSGTPTPVCFVTPDRAFLEQMQSCDCVFLRSFSDAVDWIQKHGSSGSGAI